jgi:hypothetical protein
MSTLGVVVVRLQGMGSVARCLESIQWADAVMVIDLDDGDKDIFDQEIKQTFQDIGTDWVLFLWGEERVEVELGKELLKIRQAELDTAPEWYCISIRSFILRRWVQGSLWGPTPAPRLLRTFESFTLGWWNPVSKRFQDAPRVSRGWIGDYSCGELSNGMDRVNSVSSFWARGLRSERRSIGPVALTMTSLRVLMQLLFHNKLLFKGLAGWSLSLLAAYATLTSGMKSWETRRFGP